MRSLRPRSSHGERDNGRPSFPVYVSFLFLFFLFLLLLGRNLFISRHRSPNVTRPLYDPLAARDRRGSVITDGLTSNTKGRDHIRHIAVTINRIPDFSWDRYVKAPEKRGRTCRDFPTYGRVRLPAYINSGYTSLL